MRLRKKTNAFLLYLLSFIFCFQVLVYPQDSKVSLWKVTSSTSTVYLLGSIHFLTPESYPLNPSIEDAFNECSTAIFEMNLDEAHAPEVQSMMMMKSMFQEGETLHSTLSEETYVLADSAAKKMGLSIEQFNGFKPWFFALYLVAQKIQRMGYNPEYGVDVYLFKRAKEREIKIEGLETAAYQIEVLDALVQENQDELLLQTISEMDMMDRELNDLVKAWKHGQSKKMEAILLSSFQDYPKIYKAMLVQRNKNWMPIIETYLNKEGKTIVIVGTAHLVGPDGLVKKLINQGHVVVQLDGKKE